MVKITEKVKSVKYDDLKHFGKEWEIYAVEENSSHSTFSKLNLIIGYHDVYARLIKEKRKYIHCKTKRIIALSVLCAIATVIISATGYGFATDNYEPLNAIYQPCVAMACIVVWHYFRLRKGDDDDERDQE